MRIIMNEPFVYIFIYFGLCANIYQLRHPQVNPDADPHFDADIMSGEKLSLAWSYIVLLRSFTRGGAYLVITIKKQSGRLNDT